MISRRRALQLSTGGLAMLLSGCSTLGIGESQNPSRIAYVDLLNVSDRPWSGTLEITEKGTDERIRRQFTLEKTARTTPDNQERISDELLRSRSNFGFHITTNQGPSLTITSQQIWESAAPDSVNCMGVVFAFRSDETIGAFGEFDCAE